MVLDEPTSGLDSFTALSLLRTLRAVAEGGRAVLLSLHQPSPVLFDAMDQARGA
jgi:ABC-type multidrug transport system ATPase subunit